MAAMGYPSRLKLVAGVDYRLGTVQAFGATHAHTRSGAAFYQDPADKLVKDAAANVLRYERGSAGAIGALSEPVRAGLLAALVGA